MRRFLPVLALAAVLFTAAPAWAHEEINPSSIPTNKPTFLTLNAANEKAADLTKITITAPSSLDFGEATRSPSGWTADHSGATITWTGGKVAHEQFDQWGFEIEGADQPGAVTYKVTLGYADGSSDDVDVVVTVTDAVTGSGGPSATVDSDTTVPPVSVDTGSGTPSASADTGNDGNGPAIGLAALAVVLSLVAIVLGARRTRGGTASASPPAAAKDW